MPMRFTLPRIWILLTAAALLASPAASMFAQDSAGESRDADASLKQREKAQKKEEAAQKGLTEEERRERLRSFKKEVGKTYQTWLNEDVLYIITPDEQTAFKLLGTDEERDAFIEQFWLRRNPDPESVENAFREEHYRRMQYANEHFSAGISGWRTDRGHIYIVWGPADETESHASGGTYQRTAGEGGGSTSTYPFERWRYRHLEGVGEEVVIEFVDTCMCNDYHIATDPHEKDALLHTPGGGPTYMEQMGVGDRASRISGLPSGASPFGHGETSRFDALEQYVKLTAPPPIKFKDLEEKVNTRIRYNLLPFEMRSDFVKITSETVLVPITIQIKTRDLTFVEKEGIQRAAVNIFGRVTHINGRVVARFEDTVGVDEPKELLEKALLTSQVYWKTVPLKPGLYKIDIAVKDVNGNRVGTLTRSLPVPEFDEEKLSSSSVILADLMERLPPKSTGAGSFDLGDTRVRPRPDAADGKPASFRRGQNLNVWLQVYNLQQDQQSHHHATISYDVVSLKTNKSVVHLEEPSSGFGSSGNQITVRKIMPLSTLEPGTYSFNIVVKDELSKQTITPSAKFQVE